MYTNMRELDGACRECALVGSECVRKSPQMDNIMTDEMIMKKVNNLYLGIPGHSELVPVSLRPFRSSHDTLFPPHVAQRTS